jgi:hypothetical protein
MKIKSFETFNEEKNWIQDAIKNKGALKKSLKKDKISKLDIDDELDKLKDKDKDPDKKGLQLSKRDRTKQKRLILAKTLANMNESILSPLDIDDDDQTWQKIDNIVDKVNEIIETINSMQNIK